MSSKIIINSAVGSFPVSFYVCGIDLNNCVYVGSASTITSPVEFILPVIFNGAPQIIIKLIDNNGCEIFRLVNCDDECLFQLVIYDETTYPCLFD